MGARTAAGRERVLATLDSRAEQAPPPPPPSFRPATLAARPALAARMLALDGTQA